MCICMAVTTLHVYVGTIPLPIFAVTLLDAPEIIAVVVSFAAPLAA